MSESVTQTALIEDCLAIMLVSDQICEAFKEVAQGHENFAQFGRVTDITARFPVQLLEKYRDNWDSHKRPEEEIGFRSAPLVPKTKPESILAFVLGWLCHRAAEHHLKPETAESGMYRDAFLFHRLYVNNSNTPEPYRTEAYDKKAKSLPASASISSGDVQELFQVIQQRLLIEMHTFVPDVEDIEGWLDRLHANYQERAAYMDRYAEAVMNPDPAKVQQLVTDTNFYDDEDAIIQLAQAVRQGRKPSQETIEAAFAAEPGSSYAKALKEGLGNLRNASVFFSGGIESNKLNKLLAV
jgi:hypothetical protein